MHIIEKILGLDALCSYYGNAVGTGPEYECIPLVVLQGRGSSLIPGYTIRKYWDKERNVCSIPSYQDEPWDGLINPTEEEPTPVIIPFPQRITTGPRMIISSLKSLLVPRDPKINYLNVENVKDVDKFDFPGFGDMVEYTKVNGMLTMIMSDMEGVCALLSGFNRGIVGRFKYCVMRYSYAGKINISAQEPLMLYMTFLDLGMCTPIFDSGKIDGVGVMCEYIHKYPDGSDYILTGSGMSMLLSNNSENIITVDGTMIGEHSLPRTDLIKPLIKIAMAVQQLQQPEQQRPVKPDNLPDIVNVVPDLHGNNYGNNIRGGYNTFSSGGSNTSSGYYTISTS